MSSNKDREDLHGSVRKVTKQNLLAKQVRNVDVVTPTQGCYCSISSTKRCLHCLFTSKLSEKVDQVQLGAPPPGGREQNDFKDQVDQSDAFLY